jgi:transcriptional regulator with XRE-family HTH domain
MNKLQRLIHREIEKQVSMRQIARDAGVVYTSVFDYYHSATEPRGKNLKKLANYFGVDPHTLMEDEQQKVLQISHALKTAPVEHDEWTEIAKKLTVQQRTLLLDLASQFVASNEQT